MSDQSDFVRFVGLPISPLYRDGDVTAALEHWITNPDDLGYKISRTEFALCMGVGAGEQWFLVLQANESMVRFATRGVRSDWDFHGDPFVNVDQRLEAHLKDATALTSLRGMLLQDKCLARILSPVVVMGWVSNLSPIIKVRESHTIVAAGPWPVDEAWYAQYIEPWEKPVRVAPTVVLPLPIHDQPSTPYAVSDGKRLYFPRDSTRARAMESPVL